MEQMSKYGSLVGRILLSLIFLMAVYGKITDFGGTQGYMASRGMPATALLAFLAIIIELGGGLSVVLGYKARLGAFALFVFLIPATLIFHTTLGGEFAPEQAWVQPYMVMKNLAIMGGLLVVAAHGAGPLSMDGKGA